MFDRRTNSHRSVTPARALMIALPAVVILAAIPVRWTEPFKSHLAWALQPGQVAAQELRTRANGWGNSARSFFASSSRLGEAENELAELRRQNRQLTGELAAIRMQMAVQSQADAGDSAGRLLRIASVEAHVLGRQAMAFLGRQQLLDVGARSGVHVDALVAAAPLRAVIDRGQDSKLSSGRLVLSGCRVWGRVAEVGRMTSVVRTVTEAGYRDLVRLASPGSASRRGPEGMLEGIGEPLARIRRMAVTEPVAVGDLVYAAAEQGQLSEPPLYGRIVRVERPVGAAHWELWMESALAGETPDRVAVLCSELNPVRTAAAGK
jgi:cell shape-determining protein MreC